MRSCMCMGMCIGQCVAICIHLHMPMPMPMCLSEHLPSLAGAYGLRRHEGRGSRQQKQIRPRCQAGSTHTLAHAYAPMIAA